MMGDSDSSDMSTMAACCIWNLFNTFLKPFLKLTLFFSSKLTLLDAPTDMAQPNYATAPCMAAR
jgi:hypothetical protein